MKNGIVVSAGRKPALGDLGISGKKITPVTTTIVKNKVVIDLKEKS